MILRRETNEGICEFSNIVIEEVVCRFGKMTGNFSLDCDDIDDFVGGQASVEKDGQE